MISSYLKGNIKSFKLLQFFNLYIYNIILDFQISNYIFSMRECIRNNYHDQKKKNNNGKKDVKNKEKYAKF